MVIAMVKKILCLTLLWQGYAYADNPIPEQIRVPTGSNSLLSLHAKGEQIYQCTLEAGKFAWQLQAPDAILFDTHGMPVGKHGAGPTWQYQDDSQVRGRVLSKIDLTPDSAISWLLVEAVEHKGKGVLADVDFINRINTQGGLPPVTGCNGNHLGSEKRVTYTADYVFYKK